MIPATLSALLVVILGARLIPRAAARRAVEPNTSPRARRRSRTILCRPRRRRPDLGPDEVAQWCDRLARSVRGGSTLTAAIADVPPPEVCDALIGDIALALDRGTPLRDALMVGSAASTDLGAGAVHLDVALITLRACALHGGPAAEPIDRAASVLRARAADEADRRTHSAQARLSATVMTVLPGAMLLVLLLTSSPVRGVVAGGAGATAIVVGAGLNLGGWCWMRRIIDGAHR